MSVEYNQALSSLPTGSVTAVQAAFATWSTDAILQQVALNISDERALAVTDFASLLTSFVNGLAMRPPLDSWFIACRAHKRRGRQIPVGNCPVVLCSAKGLDDHAASVATMSGGLLTKMEAKRQLLKHSGSPVPAAFESFLRASFLGNYNLVWATFDSASTSSNPFNRLPATHGGICTALGLGGSVSETLIILVWNHAASGSPPIHRPTVADAEAYQYYRPNADAVALWGLTAPLPPNTTGLSPQPEVVMTDPTCRGLLLPFVVIRV